MTNQNITSSFVGLENSAKFSDDEVHCSFLPLSHVFERLVELFFLQRGAKIVYYGGDVLKIKEDWELVKPTFIAIVPRLL